MDAFTAQHLAAWLDRVVPEDEQDATRDGILAIVAADATWLDTHSWVEIRRMAETAR